MRHLDTDSVLFAGVCALAIAACGLSEDADDGGGGFGGSGNAGAEKPGTGGGGPGDPPGSDDDYSVQESLGTGGSGGITPPVFDGPRLCDGVDFVDAERFGFRPPSSRSNGSAALAASLLYEAEPIAPPAYTIAPEDFISHFVRPSAPTEVRLTPDLLVDDDAASWTIQVAVQAPNVTAHAATGITFAVDTTPSMEGAPLSAAKAVLTEVVSQIKTNDVVTVVTGSGKVLSISPNGGSGAIADLAVEMDADMGRLLDLGVEQAKAQPQASLPGGSYLVLLTDGMESLPADATQQLGAFSPDGQLRFVGVGVGTPSGYEPGLLHQLAISTGGQKYFIASSAEAKTEFGAGHFAQVFGTFAYNPRIEIEVPAYLNLPDPPLDLEQTDDELATRRWLPGEMLVLRRELWACAPGLQADMATFLEQEPTGSLLDEIVVTLKYADPEGVEQERTANVSAFLDCQQCDAAAVAQENQNLAVVSAALTFADALAAPTPNRLLAADELFAELMNANVNLGDMPDLLRRHPAFPVAQ